MRKELNLYILEEINFHSIVHLIPPIGVTGFGRNMLNIVVYRYSTKINIIYDFHF
jgi:hypothetical protein